MTNFAIRGDNYHWIDNDPANRTDLCLHGHVAVTIGETELEADGTVSAAALLLLKSITEDHIAGEDIQMVPCCGHFFCPDEAEENVTIIGCNTGLDWTITHDGDTVMLTLPDCAPVPVAKREYIAEVLRFADTVEGYYTCSEPRELPSDPYERKGYEVFRKEWHRRYREAERRRDADALKKRFENSLIAGNGSAYIQLRDLVTARGKREYASILAEIMCQENYFDWQNRAGYFLDLYDLFAPPEQEKILQYVLDRPLETRFEVLQTYAPVLKAFADRGVNEAQTVLETLYSHHRSAYDNRTEQPTGYDETGSIVMYLCDVLEKELPPSLQNTGEKPQEPELTMETIIENAVHWQPVRTFHPARYRKFLQVQPLEKIIELAEAAMAETDPETQIRIYSLFDAVDFPGDPAEMIELLRGRLDILAGDWYSIEDMMERQKRLGTSFLVRALARLRHPAIRKLGWEMAEKSTENKNLRKPALELICSNFDEDTDLAPLTDFLEVVPPWENDRNTQHDEDYIVLTRMFTRHYENPLTYGFLKTIYYYTYCPDCRYKAVKILAEHGMLPEHIREQCLWDCDPATRQLAKKMDGKTK